jgi:hypothetical protein
VREQTLNARGELLQKAKGIERLLQGPPDRPEGAHQAPEPRYARVLRAPWFARAFRVNLYRLRHLG